MRTLNVSISDNELNKFGLKQDSLRFLKFIQHVEGTEGIYEIRVEVGSNIFRAFSFFDEGQLIIITNAFQKKAQKTPKKELDLAKNIKKEYFNEKANKPKKPKK